MYVSSCRKARRAKFNLRGSFGFQLVTKIGFVVLKCFVRFFGVARCACVVCVCVCVCVWCVCYRRQERNKMSPFFIYILSCIRLMCLFKELQRFRGTSMDFCKKVNQTKLGAILIVWGATLSHLTHIRLPSGRCGTASELVPALAQQASAHRAHTARTW